MTAARKAALDRLLDCGRSLLDSAGRRNWEATAEEQAALRRFAEDFFSEPVAAEDAEAVAEVLRELLGVHDTVLGLANQQRDGLWQQLSCVSTGRRAVRAYAAGAA